MTVLTAAELALLRTRPHYARLYLSIYRPTTILAARVNNTTAAKGDRSIPYDNAVSSGTVVAGMTLLIGTTSGGSELGRLRVRSDTGSVLTVATNNILWVDNAYLTVVNYFEPWSIWPNMVIDSADVATFYKDYDIPYTNQNEYYDPIPVMGPNRAVNMASGIASLYFDGSGSYCLDEAAGGANAMNINSYSWSFPGGTPATSAVATPGNVTWDTPGHYVVSLTVTTGTHSYTGYRHISVYNTAAPATSPILDWGITSLSGDYKNGGWSGKFWMRQSASKVEVPDDALIVIYSDNKYGSTSQNIGGNYPNCSGILFTGYVLNGSVDRDPVTNVVTFEATNLAGRLAVSENLGVNVESCPKPTSASAWVASNPYTLNQYVRPTVANGYAYRCLIDGTSGSSQPTWPTAVGSKVETDGSIGWQIARDWFHLREATVDRCVYHYLRWHSTVYMVADVTPNGTKPAGNTIPLQYGDFGRQPLFKALDDFLMGTLQAHVCVDRQGKVWMETKADLVDIATRSLNTTMTLTKADWRDKWTFNQRRVKPISYVEISGWVYTGPVTSVWTAVTSAAPSIWPDYEGSPTTVANGLSFLSKAYSQALSGNLFADKNKTFPELKIPMSGTYTCFDIAPQERLIVNLTPSENYLGLEWTSKKFIPRQIAFAYAAENRALMVDVTVEEETDGPPGVDGPYPAQPPTYTDNPIDFSPPETPPLPPGVGQPSGTELVYVATTTHFARTRDFTSLSPSYFNVTGAITGTIKDFALDPFNPKSRACVVTTTGIWITANLDQSPPSWINAQSAAQFSTASGGKTLDAYAAVRYTIAQDELIYVLALCHSGATYYAYLGATTNNGTSFTWTSLGTTTSATAIHGLSCSQHNAGTVFAACGAGKIYRSTNYGGAFTLVYTVTGDSDPIPNIEVPYEGNSSDLLILISGGATGTTGNFTQVYLGNGGPMGTWLAEMAFSLPFVNASEARWSCNFAPVVPTGSITVTYTAVGNPSFGVGRWRFWLYNNANIIGSSAYVDGPGGSGTQTVTFSYDGTFGPVNVFRVGIDWFFTFTMTILSVVIDGVERYSAATPFIYKTTNGFATAPTNVVPAQGAAVGFRDLHAMYPLDSDLISAFAGASDPKTLVVSANGGVAWTPGLTSNGPVALGRWPYTDQQIFYLDSTTIRYSGDNGATASDKTGNWLTVMGVAFANPVNIVPVWLT